MLTHSRNEQLSQLLELSIADFDIPSEVQQLAERRYRAVGDWLDRYWGSNAAGGQIYPQGSFALGTVVRPIAAEADYDIDLVCRRELLRVSTTQQGLKSDVGSALAGYLATGPQGKPTLVEGKRCWTLDYGAEPFHMDVLPAIPNEEARPNGISITDKSYRRWLPSNPLGYAIWFKERMAEELQEARQMIAVSKRMEVDEVPDWQVKTTLQRAVQALKRHRDIRFQGREDVKPASIIITTLAGLAYAGSGELVDVISHIVETMPSLVVTRGGVLWLPNPVQPDENFADRLETEVGRREAFFEWLERAAEDFSSFTEQRGLDRIVETMSGMFGEQPASTAAEHFGTGYREARQRGALGSAAGTGMLGAVTPKRRPVPDHTFHGGTEAPRS
jgi:hypothetical protein